MDTILNAKLLRDSNGLTHQGAKGEHLDKWGWDNWLSISKDKIRERERKGEMEEEKEKNRSWTHTNFRKAVLNVWIA